MKVNLPCHSTEAIRARSKVYEFAPFWKAWKVVRDVSATSLRWLSVLELVRWPTPSMSPSTTEFQSDTQLIHCWCSPGRQHLKPSADRALCAACQTPLLEGNIGSTCSRLLHFWVTLGLHFQTSFLILCFAITVLQWAENNLDNQPAWQQTGSLWPVLQESYGRSWAKPFGKEQRQVSKLEKIKDKWKI